MMSTSAVLQQRTDPAEYRTPAPPGATPLVLSPQVAQLRDYWQRRRAGRAMPARADIDPAEIKPLLPYVIIADLLAEPLRVRYRLAGTRVCEAFGFNITGRWLEELEVNGGVPFWLAQYDRLVTTRTPIYGRASGQLADVELFCAGWALFPLSSAGVRVDQSLEIEDWTKGAPTAKYNDDRIAWSVVAYD